MKIKMPRDLKVFEYGMLKTGQHRLSYVSGALSVSATNSPNLLPKMRGQVLGEVQIVTDAELVERDWLYRGYKRVATSTVTGERVFLYVSDGEGDGTGRILGGNNWLFPRQQGDVFEAKMIDGATFSGSLREILEQMYRDQHAGEPGHQRFKDDIASRIRDMHARAVRTHAVELFFSDLRDAGMLRLRKLWPRKEEARG